MPRPAPFDQDLAEKVVALRRGGAPFDVIADRLSLTPKAAKALFDKALASYDPEINLALEADRLDRLHMAVWPEAMKGDVNAIDRVLRISERRDRVVNTPTKNLHQLRAAFDESAATSERLAEGWDTALLEAGRKIADRVDEAIASSDGVEVTKALYLIPHMLNVLREMLATPASRLAAEAKAPPAPPPTKGKGKLATLRAVHGEPGTGTRGA